MKEVDKLNQTGFVRLRTPTCYDELPKFNRKIEHIRGVFGDKVEERETRRNGRVWIEFTMKR